MNGQQIVPLIYFRGADLKERPAKNYPHIQHSTNKAEEVDILMTLKQACSSEYQGAQGAFKDSMIH
jgi:hypothetical protein